MRKILILFILFGCDDGATGGGTQDASVATDAQAFSSLTLEVAPQPAQAPAGSVLDVPLRLMTPDGSPVAGLAIGAELELGGGSAAEATTDADGRATVRWHLGPAPVKQVLRLSVGPAAELVQVDATAPEPAPTAAPFGDVPAWLAERMESKSTEDLAFFGDALVLGVPGGLIRMDPAGAIEPMALSGVDIDRPLGIAVDGLGNLWVADVGAKTLVKVDPQGVVTTQLSDDGERPLEGPNYVAVGPDGKIYLSDPCLGVLIRFDPTVGQVDATHTFDLATEGGPNGFAFRGDQLWVVTENTVLLCQHAGIAALDAPLAGLFRMGFDGSGFGQRTAVAPNAGVFGDGMAFDAEGNLYVIFDQVANLMLAESAVWVLPEGATTLRKFLVGDGVLYANLAFGKGNFGAGTLYIALLSVPPFTGPTSRGAQFFDVGIPGLPLLPESP